MIDFENGSSCKVPIKVSTLIMNIGYKKPSKQNPSKGANIFSKLFFCYLFGECKRLLNDKVNLNDLYKLDEDETSEFLGNKLEKLWETELIQSKTKNKQPSLRRVLFKFIFWKFMILALSNFMLHVVIRQMQILYYPSLIGSFSKPYVENSRELYFYMSFVLGFSFLYYSSAKKLMLFANYLGRNIRVATSSLIFRKLLKLHTSNFNETSGGTIISLSNDFIRFEQAVFYMNFIWVTPVVVAINMHFLFIELDISSFTGVALILIVTSFIQVTVGKTHKTLRASMSVSTDKRIKLLNELIGGMKVIKMYSWEKPFEKLVHTLRLNETNFLRYVLVTGETIAMSSYILASTALYVSIVTFSLMGHQLTGRSIFGATRFFFLIQFFISLDFTMCIKSALELDVMVKRLEKLLLLDEKPTLTENKDIEIGQICLRNVFATHGSDIRLRNINVVVPSGIICAVVGPVGSGKSCLLQILLNELKVPSGEVSINGKIAYASQEPWLFSSTIKDNILFGRSFNPEKYNSVLDCCCLKYDLDQFYLKDLSLVGENGVILSGGQKARLGLARALYQKADIYLLDDPLSAVDTNIGNELFDKSLIQHLKGKTRILITHQLQYLRRVDLIVVMHNGTIESTGSFESLLNSNQYIIELVEKAEENCDVVQTKNVEIINQIENPLEDTNKQESYKETENEKSPLALYLEIGSNKYLAIWTIITFILLQMILSGSDFWIKIWVKQDKQTFNALHHSGNLSKLELTNIMAKIHDSEHFYIMVYSGLIGFMVLVGFIRIWSHIKLCIRSSIRLHKRVFNCLINTKLQFFETRSAGKILNIFSKEMGDIDEFMPFNFLWLMQCLLLSLGCFCVVALCHWSFALINLEYVVIIFIILRILGKVLYKTKQLEGQAKAPVYGMMKACYTGICTIRSSGIEKVLRKEFDDAQDLHTSAANLVLTIKAAVRSWIVLIGFSYMVSMCALLVVLHIYDKVDDTTAGLVISQIFFFSTCLNSAVSFGVDCLNSFAGVRRILEYLKLVPEEEISLERYTEVLTTSWPMKASIEFKNVFMQYKKNQNYVLSNINFFINPNEKVGIVGRTGAGKSSLITVLFRLINFEGIIQIDGLNTKNITLHQLRSKMSIIPQDPVLFCNTLRYNLDPFQEYADKEIWKVLEEVNMRDAVTSLDLLVTEGGSNFSVGQRQLLCLARAILRKNKILILDEATANVDLRTDIFIQTTIRKIFKHCTVLTIAHRLNTVMDSDKVLVLSDGQVMEFDHPHVLLNNKDGCFTRLVSQTGVAMKNKLEKIAREDYYKKYVLIK